MSQPPETDPADDGQESEPDAADVDEESATGEGDSDIDDPVPVPDEEPSPPAVSEQQPTHHRDRRALVLTAIAAAVIGALATVVIGAVTIWYAGEQSVDEFRRDQRQTQYTNILSKATDLKNATEFAGADLNILGSVGYPNIFYNNSYNNSYSSSYPYYYDGTYHPFPPGSTTSEKYTALGSVRNDWQSAYAALDQAIAEAQIAGKCATLNIARALRDQYRADYAEVVGVELDAIKKALEALQRMTNPDHKGPTIESITVDQLVGVTTPEPVTCPDGDGADEASDGNATEVNPATDQDGDDAGARKAAQLTAKYVKATKEELELNDE